MGVFQAPASNPGRSLFQVLRCCIRLAVASPIRSCRFGPAFHHSAYVCVADVCLRDRRRNPLRNWPSVSAAAYRRCGLPMGPRTSQRRWFVTKFRKLRNLILRIVVFTLTLTSTLAVVVGLTLVASPAAHTQTFNVIHNFTGPEGANPEAGVSIRGGSLFHEWFTGLRCGLDDYAVVRCEHRLAKRGACCEETTAGLSLCSG